MENKTSTIKECPICGKKFEYGIEAHPLGTWTSFCSHECVDKAYEGNA